MRREPRTAPPAFVEVIASTAANELAAEPTDAEAEPLELELAEPRRAEPGTRAGSNRAKCSPLLDFAALVEDFLEAGVRTDEPAIELEGVDRLDGHSSRRIDLGEFQP